MDCDPVFSNIDVVNFASFIFNNLIPVTLGNIIGGASVGVIMYVAHLKYAKRSDR